VSSLAITKQYNKYSSCHQISHLKATEGLQPHTAHLEVSSTALLALLHCYFWAVFTRLDYAIRVATV
jgi:hypothetical protein